MTPLEQMGAQLLEKCREVAPSDVALQEEALIRALAMHIYSLAPSESTLNAHLNCLPDYLYELISDLAGELA